MGRDVLYFPQLVRERKLMDENITYYRQVFSKDDWAIGMEGDDKHYMERRFWSFWNWKATNGSLDWWTDRFAVFWTDEARFRQAVLEIYRTQVLRDIGDEALKGVKGGVDYLARDCAESFMDTMLKDEQFYTQKMRTIELNTHAELTIAAEDLSDYDAVKA